MQTVADLMDEALMTRADEAEARAPSKKKLKISRCSFPCRGSNRN